jgi:hypothetical protein
MYKNILKAPSSSSSDLIKTAQQFKLKLNSVAFKSQLYNIKPELGCYIINMANGAPGTHWVGLINFMIDNKPQSYYYDPFGIIPPVAVINFCKRWGDVNITRGREFQQDPNNGYCGAYVMLFLYYMTHNKGSPDQRLKEFNKLFINHTLF